MSLTNHGVCYNRSVNTNIRRVLVLLLFLISTLIAIWGFWPVGSEIRTVSIYPADMQLPGHQGDSGAPAILEERSLILESPRRLRLRGSRVYSPDLGNGGASELNARFRVPRSPWGDI